MIGDKGTEQQDGDRRPASNESGSEHTVLGERTTAIVHAARSTQSKVSGLLSAGLMIALGLSALSWYYAHALSRTTRVRQEARTAATRRAQGEMPLPSIGHIEPPRTISAPVADRTFVSAHDRGEPTLAEVPADPLPEAGHPATATVLSGTMEAHSPASVTHPSALTRRLAGTVLARNSDSPTEPSAVPLPGTTTASGLAMADSSGIDHDSGTRGSSKGVDEGLSGLLRAQVTPSVPAQILPTQRFLLPQGSFIDCTLETAIDSTFPGMTTCITASDTFGADGKVVLLERGTKLVGETRGQLRQGQARVFVLWTEARTPAGVVVPLASPGTDELGRAGLPGEVDRHFWQRFGAGLLITLIDGAVQAGVQASNHSGGTVIYTPSTSQDVLTEVLKDSVAIPPTVVKHNGDRIQVLVARDLDFRGVYELRVASSGP
jgi:type IV secretion system protein VirB10